MRSLAYFNAITNMWGVEDQSSADLFYFQWGNYTLKYK